MSLADIVRAGDLLKELASRFPKHDVVEARLQRDQVYVIFGDGDQKVYSYREFIHMLEL